MKRDSFGYQFMKRDGDDHQIMKRDSFGSRTMKRDNFGYLITKRDVKTIVLLPRVNFEIDGTILAELRVKLIFHQQIRDAQTMDVKLGAKRKHVENGQLSGLSIIDDGILYF
ncbi:Inositol hexakisphosphate and diphosphoinositol-pentakisphosphate kinase 2 [Gossypium australe]|uniref:Inositol hexakisphosphate and diphosphoinositol-pentakisphosphate kinase 2 n=1 Tax=Gossypium australe TaxID=47621 RepID=A0A5B6WZW3_9ROSI|nr:Inositol hexakisphosphate and diphosphoinositol-pentakisphosphate kinase 2 [Gossypium australe]